MLRVWDLETNEVRIVRTGEPLKSVAFSPDGTILAAGGVGPIELWDAETGEKRAALEGHQALVRSIVFSPRGGLLASASGDATVRLWDVRTGEARAVLEGQSDGQVWSVAFSPDGRTLASAGTDGTITLWDVDGF